MDLNYGDFPDLMTPEELEDWHHEPSDDVVSTLPPFWRSMFIMSTGRSPEAEYRKDFEARPPALGLTGAQINELEAHGNHPQLLPTQRRSLFGNVQSTMLRHLIPASGCATLADLCHALREELQGGTPAPVPDWYVYSTKTMGPRKIGYDACEHRGCLNTETVGAKFSKCSKCRMACYCSRECQGSDWKARHRKVCQAAAKQRDMMARVGEKMQFLSDASLSGGGGGGFADLLARLQAGQGPDPATAAAVAARRAHLKAEKKRKDDK
jgi:hypothetical protein